MPDLAWPVRSAIVLPIWRKEVVTCAPDRNGSCCAVSMEEVKDTLRATVRVSYDGRVYKIFRGPDAQERFANEVRVLRHLEKKKCNFVPMLLEANAEQLRIVTTNCGVRVEHLDKERAAELFAELEPYGVRHEDAEVRN